MLESGIAVAARAIEAIAALMIVGSVIAGVIDLLRAAFRGQMAQRMTESRLRLAERLVLSLEFLIAADILKTVLTPTLDGIGLVAGINLNRTVLSLSNAYELRKAGPASLPLVPPHE